MTEFPHFNLEFAVETHNICYSVHSPRSFSVADYIKYPKFLIVFLRLLILTHTVNFPVGRIRRKRRLSAELVLTNSSHVRSDARYHAGLQPLTSVVWNHRQSRLRFLVLLFFRNFYSCFYNSMEARKKFSIS